MAMIRGLFGYLAGDVVSVKRGPFGAARMGLRRLSHPLTSANAIVYLDRSADRIITVLQRPSPRSFMMLSVIALAAATKMPSPPSA